MTHELPCGYYATNLSLRPGLSSPKSSPTATSKHQFSTSKPLGEALDLALLGHLDLPGLRVRIRIRDLHRRLHDNGRDEVPEDEDADANKADKEEASDGPRGPMTIFK